MASSTVTLAPFTAPAEKLDFGPPRYVSIDTGTAGALSATLVPTNASQQAVCYQVELSYSAAPAVSVFTIKDGTTVIWQREISASAPFVHTFDFTKRPLRATAGATLSANVGSAGGSVVQTIMLSGDIVAAA